MPTRRNVTATFNDFAGNIGTVLQGIPIKVTHINGNSFNDIEFPGITRTFYTDSEGNIKFIAWCNEEGDRLSYYRFELPGNDVFEASIPLGTSDISINVLRQGGVNSSDPNYETLISFITTEVLNNLPSGGGGPIPVASATVRGVLKTNTTVADPIVYLKSEVDALIAGVEGGNFDPDLFYTRNQTDTLLNAKVSTTTFNTTLTAYYTAVQVDALLSNVSVDLTGYYTSAQINTLLADKVNISALTAYYTSSEVDTLLAGKVNTSALTAYYTASQVDTLLSGKANISAIPTDFYTQAQVDNIVNNAVAPLASTSALTTHTANTSNPHSTTAAQVGSYTTAETDALLVDKANISDVYNTTQTDSAISSAIAPLATTTALTTHTNNTSNPHNTTAAQVGNTVAQWNASQIRGVNVTTGNPVNGHILKYNSTTQQLEYAPDLAGEGATDLTNVAFTNISQEFSGVQSFNEIDVTFNASLNLDLSTGQIFNILLTGNITNFNASNLIPGASYLFNFIQDGIGSRTLTGINSKFHFPSGIIPTLSTTPGIKDTLSCVTDDGVLKCVLVKGFAPPTVVEPPDGDISDHILNVDNPHNTTAAQVGNTIAQWNANRIAGVLVNDEDIDDNYLLGYNSFSNRIEYKDPISLIPNLVFTNTNQVLTGVKSFNEVNVIFNPSLNINLSTGQIFNILLTGNITSFNASNLIPGASYQFNFIQDSTGNRTLSGINSKFHFPDGIIPSLSTDPNSADIISCTCENEILKCVLVRNFAPPTNVEPPDGNIDDHILDTDNPHETTAAQVGAYTTAQTDSAISSAITGLATTTALTTHTSNTTNPHNTTAAQVGAYTTAQTNTLLDAKANSTALTTHTSNTTNPHSTTASQVGAYTTAQTDSAIDDAIAGLATTSALTTHVNATNNPHSVTAAQVGSYTTAQTDSAIDDAIAGLATTSALTTHTSNTSNPHSTTAAQVGAYTTAQTDTLLNAKANSSSVVNLTDNQDVGGVKSFISAGVNASGAVTLDLSLYHIFNVVMLGNITSLNIINEVVNASYTINILQLPAGGATLAGLSSKILFPDDYTFALNASSNGVTKLSLECLNTGFLLGTVTTFTP